MSSSERVDNSYAFGETTGGKLINNKGAYTTSPCHLNAKRPITAPGM